MSKKLFVGNLSYSTTDSGLYSVFAQFGEVLSAHVVRDRFTNLSRGFGFVEMGSEEAAYTAMVAMNGQILDGRRVRVNAADDKPRDFRPSGYKGGRDYNRPDRNRSDWRLGFGQGIQ